MPLNSNRIELHFLYKSAENPTNNFKNATRKSLHLNQHKNVFAVSET